MPLNPPRVLVLRAHALEIFISGAAITLGLFVWLSMKNSNSGVNLLAGAALVVSWNYSVRFSDENYSQILNMRLLGLIIALGSPIAFLFFGLSMLLIEVVGRLWPTNSKAR